MSRAILGAGEACSIRQLATVTSRTAAQGGRIGFIARQMSSRVVLFGNGAGGEHAIPSRQVQMERLSSKLKGDGDRFLPPPPCLPSRMALFRLRRIKEPHDS